MPLTKSTTTHPITRITLHIPHPTSTVLTKLHSTLSTKSRNGLEILNHTSSRPHFEAVTNSHLGPHDFMHFATINHSDWIQLFGIHPGKSLTRVVFGNPQVAATMLEHDVTAGLFAPVEALVVDLGEGEGTEVVYLRPSDLVLAGGGEGREGLRRAAEVLDGKLERLWEWVAGDGEE